MPIKSVLTFVRSKISLIGEWLRLAWRSIDVDDMPEITDYPDHHGELQFRAGVAALNGHKEVMESRVATVKIAYFSLCLGLAATIISVLFLVFGMLAPFSAISGFNGSGR